MLSWEYPPKIVGGIARHVEEISWALAARGDEVHVVTCEFPGAPAEETYNGVQIHRVAPYQLRNAPTKMALSSTPTIGLPISVANH
jgi:glycosyltransferase involved in cell wall biosynthesis